MANSFKSDLARQTILIALGIFCYQASYCQKITNVDFGIFDNTIRISYDLIECPANETYDIELYLYAEGKLRQIQQGLSGDIKQVSCGWLKKTILWEVLSDRNELKGNIHFEVRIGDKHRIKVKKTPSFKEWKFDKGYIGASIGGFIPYGNYGNPSDNLEKNGFQMNGSFGYLFTNVIGVSGSLYWCGSEINESWWENWGLMVGPLISIPLGNKVKWDLRPMIGYSSSSIYASYDYLPDYDGGTTSGPSYNLGTALRLNLGQKASYLLSFEYFSVKPEFEGYPIIPNIATLSLSAGVAFRLY